jgi:alkylation response protein AidB-like acyl-CoA dehydrogenase
MKSRATHTTSCATLLELARKTLRNGMPAAHDPVLRDRMMQLLIREQGLAQTARRSRVAALQDHPLRLQLQNKLLSSEITQDTAALAVEVEGAAASLYLGDANAPAGGQWPMAYMNSYGFTIAAGTSEVQRNILGERVLGLAKSK